MLIVCIFVIKIEASDVCSSLSFVFDFSSKLSQTSLSLSLLFSTARSILSSSEVRNSYGVGGGGGRAHKFEWKNEAGEKQATLKKTIIN